MPLKKFVDNQVSGALLARLSELGASAPWFVDQKQLTTTDVRIDQNRLQMSSKSPISRVFTDAEKADVRTFGGMPVTAFDRRGQAYVLSCKYFRDKNFYRFRTEGWRSFLENNHLLLANGAKIKRRVIVELWAFRSRALPRGKDGEDCGHPDGALGLVVLHRDEGEGGEQELVEAQVPPEEEAVMEYAEEGQAAVVVQEQVADVMQQEAPADAYAQQGEGEAGAEVFPVVVPVQEEVPLEQGEAEAHAEGCGEVVPPWLAGAVLLTLRTSNRTKRKRRDDDD